MPSSERHKRLLALILTLSLIGCAQRICEEPIYPIAGEGVAVELERYCSPEKCPGIIDYFQRVAKSKGVM